MKFKQMYCVPNVAGREYYGEREGVVVGESNDGTSWRVKWNGNKTPLSLPKEYIRVMKSHPPDTSENPV